MSRILRQTKGKQFARIIKPHITQRVQKMGFYAPESDLGCKECYGTKEYTVFQTIGQLERHVASCHNVKWDIYEARHFKGGEYIPSCV